MRLFVIYVGVICSIGCGVEPVIEQCEVGEHLVFLRRSLTSKTPVADYVYMGVQERGDGYPKYTWVDSQISDGQVAITTPPKRQVCVKDTVLFGGVSSALVQQGEVLPRPLSIDELFSLGLFFPSEYCDGIPTTSEVALQSSPQLVLVCTLDEFRLQSSLGGYAGPIRLMTTR